MSLGQADPGQVTAPEAGALSSGGERPGRADVAKIKALVWMRSRHHTLVNDGRFVPFRRRRIPTSGMPQLVRACGKYPHMAWVPDELMVPERLPPEGRLPKPYLTAYYGTVKLGWGAYNRNPIDPDVDWDPSFPWNHAFPPTGDGWEHPTSDVTFARLRTQGPNPWLLRRVDDRPGPDGRPEPTFALDYTRAFAGVLPPIVARFAVRHGHLVPTDIAVGDRRHQPGDPTWDQAKRMVNAADVRLTVFGTHLLGTHLVVGAAFAMAAYRLPTWHRLRPFMQFFTYGTLEVNHTAYQALVAPGSYFIESGFATIDDASRLFANLIADFDLQPWTPPDDITARGIDAVPDHPYVQDALLVWPAFVEVVERHLTELRLDHDAIAADEDLQGWFRTLTGLLPGTEPEEQPLDRDRLSRLCTTLLWNNVVHEIAGDFSPITGSEDPADKAMLNLAKVKAAVGDGDLSTPVEAPTMADVFLMDQASFMSRFNVGGNNIVRINAAALVDDPKLRIAIEDLQATLAELETQLEAANERRPVRFARMFPRHWEASISY